MEQLREVFVRDGGYETKPGDGPSLRLAVGDKEVEKLTLLDDLRIRVDCERSSSFYVAPQNWTMASPTRKSVVSPPDPVVLETPPFSSNEEIAEILYKDSRFLNASSFKGPEQLPLPFQDSTETPRAADVASSDASTGVVEQDPPEPSLPEGRQPKPEGVAQPVLPVDVVANEKKGRKGPRRGGILRRTEE